MFSGHVRLLIQSSALAKVILNTIVLKVAAALSTLLMSILIGRYFGASGAGGFYLGLTLLLIIATVCRLGMDQALLKFISADIATRRSSRISYLYRRSSQIYLAVAGLMSVMLFYIAGWLSESVFSGDQMELVIKVMSFCLIPFGLIVLQAASLQGLGRIAQSVIVLSLLIPCLSSFVLIIIRNDFGFTGLLWSYFVIVFVVSIIGHYLVKSGIGGFSEELEASDLNGFFKKSRPLFLSGLMGLLIIWTPLLILGVYGSSEDVGVYSAVVRTATLVTFLHMAVNTVLAPRFSALYSTGAIERLGVVVRNSAKISFLLSLPVVLALLIFPSQIISLFGMDFVYGAYALQIVTLGQAFNSFSGSGGYLLNMAGGEKIMRSNTVFCAILTFALSIFFIPKYGLISAAYVTAAILILQNSISIVAIYCRYSIISIPLSFRLEK